MFCQQLFGSGTVYGVQERFGSKATLDVDLKNLKR